MADIDWTIEPADLDGRATLRVRIVTATGPDQTLTADQSFDLWDRGRNYPYASRYSLSRKGRCLGTFRVQIEAIACAVGLVICGWAS